MPNDELHLSDQELLLIADGELPLRRAAQARSHLAACWTCRERERKIEETIVDFIRLHHSNIDPHLTSAAGSRAVLKARLTDLAVVSRPPLWSLFLRSAFAGRFAACVSIVVLFAAVGIWEMHRQHLQPEFESTFASPAPNRSLTPGATRPVTISDICTVRQNEAAREIPISVQRKVFQEYGLANAQPEDYELDYLITPELGGSDDLRNLWPEPHSATVWNSYVKDDLENRLHQLVCSGSVELATAQHDISTDWITAYKKYFHTDSPSPIHSSFTLSPHGEPIS